MDFLKTRLENLTSHTLDVIPIFEFLHELSPNSTQQTKLRLDAFRLKWENQNYPKSLTLAYCSGSWKPSAAGTTVIAKQNYDDYLKQNYKLTIAEKGRTGVCPFTFEELAKEDFWIDLCKHFGQKTLSFIFEKSLIISEVEKDFYLLIASDGCMLNQKISKTAVIPPKRYAVAQPTEPSHSFTFNPYSINSPTVVKLPLKHRETRKRRLSMDSLNDELRKKAKIVQDDSGVLLQENTVNNSSESQISSSNNVKVFRWFKPTPKIAQFLIEERERLKQTFGVASKSHPTSDANNQMYFVGIVRDEDFRKISTAQNNILCVLKQSTKINFLNKRIPPDWDGLKVEEPDTHSKDRKYYVTVFKISETFARNNNIRVNGKQRRRKCQAGNISDPGDSDLESRDNNRIPNVEQPFVLNPNSAGTKPFNPFLMLETLPALYNKSSWSKWPKTNIMSAACASDEGLDGAATLLGSILGTDVGSSYDRQILHLVSLPSRPMNNLLSIIEPVVTFHKRVKDIHKLVKCCLMNWMIKLEGKNSARVKKKQQRNEWRNLNPKRATRKNTQVPNHSPLDTASSGFGPTPDLPHFDQTTSEAVSIPSTTTTTSHVNSCELKPSNQSTMPKRGRRIFAYAKLKQKIPYSCILMALKQIFHLSQVENFLGSKKNIRNFFRFIRKSIILAGTKSSLQFGQLMSLLDPYACAWLEPIKHEDIKRALLAKVAKWLFSNYIITILRVSFYITEVNTSRLHACFYLRESWKSITESVRHRLMKSGKLRHIGPFPTGHTPKHAKLSHAGINSKIRFLPKKNHDLRPILSYKKETRSRWDETHVKLILNFILRKSSPHRIRDGNLTRQRWLAFLKDWETMGKPKLYFVRADIQDAYPSVVLDKLKAIITSKAQELGTILQKDFKVISRSRIMFRQTVINPNQSERWNSSIFVRPCIVQSTQKKTFRLNVMNAFNKLFPFANPSTLRIGKHKYGFEYGLPQGWVLSEALCNLYYGDMDAKYLSNFLSNKGEFFNTAVDDYIYITPNPQLAAKFLRKVEAGFPVYNCNVNVAKIVTNIYPRVDVPVPEQECEWICFCGWQFCLSCGHIMRDFGGYAGQDMASTLSFIPRNVTCPENFLIARMKLMLPARMQIFLLDPGINCNGRIILNTLEAALVFAFRFYAICRVIYPNLNALKEVWRAKKCVAAIIGCANGLSRLIRNTFRSTYSPQASQWKCTASRENMCPCVLSFHRGTSRPSDMRTMKNYSHSDGELNIMDSKRPLETSELLFIIYHAFILKLSRHSSVFTEILPKLHKMKHFQKSAIDLQSYSVLTLVLGNSLPSQFENIKI